MMTDKEFAYIVRLIRSAPLANMSEAEAVGKLLIKFAEHSVQFLSQKEQADETVKQLQN